MYDYDDIMGGDMMTKVDIERITGNKTNQERLIRNAMNACENSTTNWGKNYWFNVWKTLCQKFGRNDIYVKNLH